VTLAQLISVGTNLLTYKIECFR